MSSTKRFFSLCMFGIFLLPSLAAADTTISSNITTNQTWTTASSTYIVTTGIAINAGVTLTINPGVIVKFSGIMSGITVNGTLNAQGTALAPIYFTSYKDDTVNGDTNGDATSTTPAGGDWFWFSIPAGGAATIDNAIIRYGGSFNTALFYNNGGNLTLANSEVASSSKYGIWTYSGISTIASSTIDHNASYGIYHTGGTTTVATSTIRDHSTYGFSTQSGTGNLILTNNIFSGNLQGGGLVNLADSANVTHTNNSATGQGKGGMVIYGSPNKAQTWGADPLFPYIISTTTGSVTVSTYAITLNPGAIIKFEGTTAGFAGNSGTFTAAGTTQSPVYFTSIKDDTVGGDTNGNGTGTTPSAGDWDGLMSQNYSNLTLNNTVIRYGGSKMLYANGVNSVINLFNSEVASSSSAGIYSDAGTVNATGTSIHDNRYGYYHGNVQGNSIAHIANAGNTIYRNSTYGIYNNGTALVNAEQVYWPATTTGATMNGPYSTSTNPGGHGDAVLPTYIDFDPWLSTVSGNIATNTTWTASSTYVIDGTLTVNAGTTLTIPAATVVKFANATSKISVSGSLVADSAASSSRIYFTSIKDDAVGGDTNGDGGATSPAAGDWDGIKVNAGGVATLNFISARYGGSGGPMLWNYAGTLDLNNSEIASSSNTGIFHSSGATQLIVRACDIHNNNYGIFVDDSSLVTIGSNNIHGNVVGVNDNTFFGIDIRYNYWGDASGPYNSVYHPTGTGDTIVENAFTLVSPWLDRVHYLYFLNHNLVTSITSGVLDWNWFNGTSTYATAWYAGVNTWNTYGNSVGGVTFATSTTATSSADLLVLDMASSSSDLFYAIYDPFVTPTEIKFNPYYMNTATANIRQMTTTHELGHALGLWHSYINNIMIASPASTTGQVSLGTQDMLDYDYCWVSHNCGI